MKRILIVGSWKSEHIRRFLSMLSKNKNENLIIDIFDPKLENKRENDSSVDNIFYIRPNKIEKKVYKIRKIGTWLYLHRSHVFFENILKTNSYDLVNIHQIPKDAYSYVKIAHKYHVRTMLTPLGSDILRASKWAIPLLKRAFAETDFVSLNKKTGFCKKVCDICCVPKYKIVDLGYGSDTLSILIETKDKLSRKQCADLLNLPISNYYICCGYNASFAQRHAQIIKAIAINKSLLPKDYCILIPLSYGAAKDELYYELSKLCKQFGLRVHFLNDYLNIDQVAALRLITDLFIHIQTTDAYNSSLQEFLIADTQIINGKWLEYPDLEAYGLPYHICDTLESLPEILAKVLHQDMPKILLHPNVLEIIKGNAWDRKILAWQMFYNEL